MTASDTAACDTAACDTAACDRPVIGILVCDRFPPETAEVAGGSLGDLYERFLHDAEPSLSFRQYDVVAGELPDDIDECDAWIATGSRADAHGDDPWVLAFLEWLRGAVAADARMVGICFGHQAIAQALGGRVERAGGWTVGPQSLRLDASEWFDAATVDIHAMHRDVVTQLPEDATLLGEGETGAVPAFRIGDHVMCVQDHPEFDEAIETFLITSRIEQIGEARAEAALARIDAGPADGPQVGRMLVDFLLDRRIR